MSREEAIKLVSRAIACIQAVSALLEATELPWHFVSLHYYQHLAATGSDSAAYFISLDQVQLGFCFARIGILILFAAAFWTCGSRIGRLLLPAQEAGPADAEAGTARKALLADRLIGPRFREARSEPFQDADSRKR